MFRFTASNTKRRTALLAGSALIAAGLMAGQAVFAPNSAHADNECAPIGTDPGDNGATADSFSCDDPIGTYTGGVTYSSDGDLTVESTVNANEFGGAGIVLTGNGADSVTFNAGVEIEGRDLVGALVDIATDTGDIMVTTALVDADAHNASGVTHGIRAISTGGGGVTIQTSGVQATSGAAAGSIGIEAFSAGGDISITTTGSVLGRDYGMVLETSGAGGIVLDLTGSVNTSFGIAAINATAGTGGLSIISRSGSLQNNIIAVSTGGADLTFDGGSLSGSVDFSGVTGSGASLEFAGGATNTGRWLGATGVLSGLADTLTMSGIGQNTMLSTALLDFGDGADTFTLGANLSIANGSAALLFGAGADIFDISGDLTVGTGALIDLGVGADEVDVSGGVEMTAATLDFGAGADAFDVSGSLIVTDTMIEFGADADTFTLSGAFNASGATALTDLETFDNAGVVLLGWSNSNGTDGFADDILSMASGTYTGVGGAGLVVDVFLDSAQQAGCDAPTGAADCFDLRGASTAGETLVRLNTVTGDAIDGAYTPAGITIVDVEGGGTSAAEHFVLDPASVGYGMVPVWGDAIVRPGLFVYDLQYDAAEQRHIVVGVPKSEALEYAVLGSAAHSIWHMTSEAVTDRQSDLRAGLDGALWMRATGDYTRRSMETTFDSYVETDGLDTSYKLYAGSVVGGMDIFAGRGESYQYVVGGQLGYVGSSFDVDRQTSSGSMKGATGGLYASVWGDAFFVDGTLNLNMLTLDHSSPELGAQTNTFLNSVGLSAEGGLRAGLTERVFVEPLATLAYVRTQFEEISLQGGEIKPSDARSLRGALGLRLGADMSSENLGVSYFLTGRAWNEFEGESGGVIRNEGPDAPYLDDFSGGFGEAEAGVNLYNEANTLSGYLTTGVKFKDGYDAINLSAGVRMRW